MGKFIKYGSFRSFTKSINENTDYAEGDLGYNPAEIIRRINKAILWVNINEVGRDYADGLANVDIYGSMKLDLKQCAQMGLKSYFTQNSWLLKAMKRLD